MKIRPILLVLLMLVLVAACGSDDVETTGPPGDTDPTSTTTSEAPDTTSSTTETPTTAPTTTSTTEPATTEPTGSAISVEDLFDGEGPRDGQMVSGFVVWDQTSARLCDVLMESFPPQCGWAWIVIANPDGLDVDLTEEQGVRWTDAQVTVEADFDGTRLILADASESVQASAAEVALIDAFVAFAADPSATTIAALPLADEVGIGIGNVIESTQTVDALSDRLAWEIDRDEYDGYAGPFSVLLLDVADRPLDITVGPHPRCAAPPVEAPEGFEDYRRLSIQPSDATSCLEWWTVDFFLDPEGTIEAITLDLFGP